MDWWSVFVEALGDNPLLVTDDALGGMATELMPHSGIVTAAADTPRGARG